MSGFQLDDFARGQIVAFHEAGLKPPEIATKITKTDGSNPKPDAVVGGWLGVSGLRCFPVLAQLAYSQRTVSVAVSVRFP